MAKKKKIIVKKSAKNLSVPPVDIRPTVKPSPNGGSVGLGNVRSQAQPNTVSQNQPTYTQALNVMLQLVKQEKPKFELDDAAQYLQAAGFLRRGCALMDTIAEEEAANAG